MGREVTYNAKSALERGVIEEVLSTVISRGSVRYQTLVMQLKYRAVVTKRSR